MDFVSGAISGGILYDFVKYGAAVTVEFLKDKLNTWVTDESMTDNIVDRLNTLGYVKGESQGDYCQRLDNDNNLQQLLQAIQTNQVNKTTTFSDIGNMGIGDISGEIHNSTINIGNQGDSSKKS